MTFYRDVYIFSPWAPSLNTLCSCTDGLPLTTAQARWKQWMLGMLPGTDRPTHHTNDGSTQYKQPYYFISDATDSAPCGSRSCAEAFSPRPITASSLSNARWLLCWGSCGLTVDWVALPPTPSGPPLRALAPLRSSAELCSMGLPRPWCTSPDVAPCMVSEAFAVSPSPTPFL